MAEQNQNKKDNRGYLYPNSNKTKPTHPDYTGTVITDGKEWRLAAWENQSTDGKKYLSLIVSPPLTPEQQQQFKRNDEPQANPNPNINHGLNAGNSNNTSSQTEEKTDKEEHQKNEQQNNYYNKMDSSNDLDDLDAILKSADDDNPFN